MQLEIRGRLTEEMYSDLVTTVNSTGNRFKIQLEHRQCVTVGDPSSPLDSNGNYTKYELVYVNHYTREIEDILSASGEYTDFGKGDYFYISVKNTNKTQSTILKQSLYGTNMETFKIGVPYGGLIRNEYDI